MKECTVEAGGGQSKGWKEGGYHWLQSPEGQGLDILASHSGQPCIPPPWKSQACFLRPLWEGQLLLDLLKADSQMKIIKSVRVVRVTLAAITNANISVASENKSLFSCT